MITETELRGRFINIERRVKNLAFYTDRSNTTHVLFRLVEDIALAMTKHLDTLPGLIAECEIQLQEEEGKTSTDEKALIAYVEGIQNEKTIVASVSTQITKLTLEVNTIECRVKELENRDG